EITSPTMAQLRKVSSAGGCAPAFFIIFEMARIPSTSIRGASGTSLRRVSCVIVKTTAPASPLTSALLISIVFASSYSYSGLCVLYAEFILLLSPHETKSRADHPAFCHVALSLEQLSVASLVLVQVSVQLVL